MERDLRLTGSLRGQSTNVEAPKGFELSNPWKVSLFVMASPYVSLRKPDACLRSRNACIRFTYPSCSFSSPTHRIFRFTNTQVSCGRTWFRPLLARILYLTSSAALITRLLRALRWAACCAPPGEVSIESVCIIPPIPITSPRYLFQLPCAVNICYGRSLFMCSSVRPHIQQWFHDRGLQLESKGNNYRC
ncbi:hypothetical protein BJX63DRAFT_12476 [Aspergillus granulosus]|uniref:Uncharacterized protein n=1 Tax=Aspergillus granulosus TaxID=176169 RepID=A0ABR4HVK6_9EURO